MRSCVRVCFLFYACCRYINRCVSTKATVIRSWVRANFPTTTATEYAFHPPFNWARYFCTSFYSAASEVRFAIKHSRPTTTFSLWFKTLVGVRIKKTLIVYDTNTICEIILFYTNINNIYYLLRFYWFLKIPKHQFVLIYLPIMKMVFV